MSKQEDKFYSIGGVPHLKAEFISPPPPRPIRVIKAADRTKSPSDYQREHEIALLKLIGPKHPEVVRELAAVVVK